MNKITILLIAGFAVAFVAGGSVGMLAGPDLPTGPAQPPEPPLRDELDLSRPQREQMRDLWQRVMEMEGPCQWQKRAELARQRDEAIEGLLTDEQRKRYNDICLQYHLGLEEMEQERQLRIAEAIRQTKEILTPEQARRYEEIRRRRHGGPLGPGPGPGPGMRRGGPFGPGRRGGGGPGGRPGGLGNGPGGSGMRRGPYGRPHEGADGMKPTRGLFPQSRPWGGGRPTTRPAGRQRD